MSYYKLWNLLCGRPIVCIRGKGGDRISLLNPYFHHIFVDSLLVWVTIFLFFVVVVVISSWQWLRFPSEQKLFIRLQHFSLSFLQFLYKVGQQNNVDFIEHSYGGKRSFNRGHKLFFQYCGRVKKKKKMQLPEGQMLVVSQ